MRCMHEASLWEDNCFVTLTYDQAHLPPLASLRYRDFQLFMKKLRRWRGADVRFYMCGEYGPEGSRPHYHALLFNCDFQDRKPLSRSGSGFLMYESKKLSALWEHGFATVQDLSRATAGYTARYVMKKATGDRAKVVYSRVDADGVMHSIEPEFSRMSLRPGIGAGWIDRFSDSTYRDDFVVADGVKYKPPRYYDKRARRAGLADFEALEFARELRGRSHAADTTDERLAVREQVHEARVRNLKRDLKC